MASWIPVAAVVVLLLAFAVQALAASPVAAAPALDVRSIHLPTHLPPGGEGRYQVRVTNVGDEPTDSGDPLTLTLELPEGLTATEASDPFGGFVWPCTISPDGRTVECVYAFMPILPGLDACENFGVLCTLVVTVAVAPDATGSHLTAIEACLDPGPPDPPVCASDDDTATISAVPAPFGIANFDSETVAEDGSPSTQAGGHPGSVSTRITFNTIRVGDPAFFTFDQPEDPKTLDVDLPVGLTGDPTVTPRCSRGDFFQQTCPFESQVGVIYLTTTAGVTGKWQIYNLDPLPNLPAQLGARVEQLSDIFIDARLRTGGDYGLTMRSTNLVQADSVLDTLVTVWGFPSDPSHDAQRGSCLGTGDTCPSSAPRSAFLTNPTSCGAGQMSVHTFSWQHPGLLMTATIPQPAIVGCEKLQFDPSIVVQPTSSRPDAPSGYDIELRVPQNDDPDGLATSHVRKVALTLPEGVSVSPSAAHGLEACSPAQIALSSDAEPTCPAASRVGTVVAETPLLEEPLSGELFVAKQNDNPFGTLLATYLVLRGPGVLVKLAGRVDPDPVTGRLTATFDDNPQLPFETLRVRLKGGPTAPLVNPPSCGVKTATAEFTPWSGTPPVSSSSSFAIDCPGVSGFAPGFSAGSVSPVGGAFSPFVARIERPDGQEIVNGVTVEMPPGLAAKLKGVPQCPEAQAAAGTCGVESRVGTATVAAGAGPSPYFVQGPVFLTGPYKGAPFGLSTVVRAVAGPFDLGTVVVRQALHVDPLDAHVTVISDPLPTILEGIPLRLRTVNVDIDRPGFTLNPTSCAEKQIHATLGSPSGAMHAVTQRFQVGDCQALALKPRLGLRLTGKRQLRRDGGHPGVRAVLTQPQGQASLERVAVALPLSLALDPENAQSDALCGFEQATKPDPQCPESSVVGTARAVTPLLDRPLTGPVYFARNQRVHPKTGNVIRTLPMLIIPLRGEVAINLKGTSSVRRGRLVNTFADIPDTPVSKFTLKLKGGKHGILTTVRNPCRGRQTAALRTDGHNGKRADRNIRIKAPCANKRKREQNARGAQAKRPRQRG